MRRNKLEATVFITFEGRLHLLPNHPGQLSTLEESSCSREPVKLHAVESCSLSRKPSQSEGTL